VRFRERLAGGLGGLQSELDDVVDGTGVAAGAGGDQAEQIVRDLGT